MIWTCRNSCLTASRGDLLKQNCPGLSTAYNQQQFPTFSWMKCLLNMTRFSRGSWLHHLFSYHSPLPTLGSNSPVLPASSQVFQALRNVIQGCHRCSLLWLPLPFGSPGETLTLIPSATWLYCLLWSLPCPRDKLVTYSFVPTLYPGHRKNPKTLNTLSYVGRPYRILDSDGLGQNLCYAALWPLAIHLTPESLNFIICKMGIINTTQRVKWGTTFK